MVKKLLLDRQSQATKQTVDGKKRLSKSILVNWLLRIFICAYAAINGKDYMLGRDDAKQRDGNQRASQLAPTV